MIDELFEQVVDELCVRVPAFLKPRIVALSASPLGWRFNLYVGTAVRSVASLTRQVHTEEGIEALLRERMEHKTGGPNALQRFERRIGRVWSRVLAACRGSRFAVTLYLLLLSALGVCAVGGMQMGTCAASLCLLWLSIAMEEDYAPVCEGVRQRYLAAVLLRGVSMLPLLFGFYRQYAHLGVQNNVVLQSAMVIMLFVHLAFYLPLIAFNKRQPVLLRAMDGVLGVLPALTVSAAIAAVFALAGQLDGALAGAMLGALGALLAFAGDLTASITTLGGIRLRGQDFYLVLFTTAGYLLMIAGAWLMAA